MSDLMTTLEQMFESCTPGAAQLVERVSWAGIRFAGEVCLEHSEIERRASVGLGALAEYRVLDLLATLPHGSLVGWADIDPVSRSLIESLPAGVVSVSAEGVKKALALPIHIHSVLRHSRGGMDMWKIQVFRNDVPARVVLRRAPRDCERIVGEALRRGVGLTVKMDDCTVDAVPPLRAHRPSTRRTLLHEVIFAAYLRQVRAPTTSSQAVNWREGFSTSPELSSSSSRA